MDSIPKFLASAYIIILAVFIAISLFMCGSSVVSAQTFYSNVADSISAVDADHEELMIKECSLLALEQGYVLKTEKKATSGSYYYELVLEYDFVVPVFGVKQVATVSGYVYPGTHVNVPG